MKKQLRKALAILCALAFAVSGVTFTPSNVKAADTWVRTNFSASGAFTRPTGTIWKFKSMNNDSNTWGNSSYCITDSSAPKTDYTKLKFRKNYVGSDGVPHNFSWSWDFATIVTVDELDDNPYNLFGLEEGKSYSGSITINATKATETSSSGQKCKLRMKFFGNNTYDVDLKQGDNVIEIPEAAYSGNGDIEFNIIQLPQYGEITVKNITLEEDTDAFIAVPTDQDYVPKEEGVSSPWTLRANTAGGSWGQMSYKIDGDIDKVESTIIRVDNPAQDDATKLEGTEVIDGKTVNHKAEIFKKKKKAELEAKHNTDPSYNVENDPEYTNYDPTADPKWATYDSQVDPEAWWWWNSGSLKDYLDGELQKGYKYKGTLTVEYTRPSSPDCNTPQLRLIVNGETIVKNLSAGSNTIAIGGSDGFMYKGEDKSLDFNLDMVDKGGIFQITSLSFTEADDFEPVTPNVEDGFNPKYNGSATPWYIKVQNDQSDPSAETWGQMSYKTTNKTVTGTTMRVDTAAHDTDIDKATALKNKRKQEAEAKGEPFDADSYVAQDDPDWATYDPQSDPSAWWWWNSAELTEYLDTILTKGKKYIGTFKFKYTAPSKSGADFDSPQLRMVANGEAHIIDLNQGSSTYSYTLGGTSGFMYTGEFPTITFNLDLLEDGGQFQVTEMTFTPADEFNHVPSLKENNNQPFVPANTPWAISVQNDQSEGQDSWGMMSYKVSGTASQIGSTYMRVDTAAHDVSSETIKSKDEIFKKKKRNALIEENKDNPNYDVYSDPEYINYDPTTDEGYASYDPTEDPDAWWWWNSAKLSGYLGPDGKDLTKNKRYVGTITYNYTAPADSEEVFDPQLRVICGGEVTVINLEAGTNKTADLTRFTYNSNSKDVEFNLDLLENGGIIQITDISFEDDGYTPVTPNVEGGEQVPNTPWYLSVQNDGENTWGQLSYLVEGTSSSYSSTKIRVESPAHDDTDPDKGIKKYDAMKNKKAKELRDKKANELLAEKYDEIMALVAEENGGVVPEDYDINKDNRYTSYDPTQDERYTGYDPTTDQEYIDYEPEEDPLWETYDPQTDPDAWWWWNSGKLKDFFKTAKDTEGNPIEDGKSYNGAFTINYQPNEGDTYPAKLRVIINGEVHVYDLEEGTKSYSIPGFDYSDTYPDLEFNFDLLGKDSVIQLSNVAFTLTDGDWTKVPDNVGDGSTIPVDYGKNIPTTGGESGAVDVVPNQEGNITHNWNIFAGIWGGHGAKLYYKNNLPDHTDQLQVRIGDGERWDPACAQIKVSNEDAYQQLDQYSQYYMTYSFYSTEEGTVHINQENYEPDKLERVDVKKGWNTFKKYLPYVDRLNYKKSNYQDPSVNITMFLTPTTYEYDPDTKKTNVVMDGEYLPKGTILSNFRIEYTRVDENDWTLVRDNRFTPIETDPQEVKDRYADCQDYDDLVTKSSKPVFSAYTNTFFNGRMSYLAGYNEDGEDDIAKMGLRLDSTAYGEDPYYEFGDTDWGCNVKIPNSYFYNRTDTNGRELVNGHHYKLRFYYHATKKTATRRQGLIMVRQGYNQNKWTSYPAAQVGMNMANGTINNKSGYNSHGGPTENGKSGGIDFVYNETATVDDQYVQVDFSMFPKDTTITDISWEFYAPEYNVYLNGSTEPDNPSPIIEGKSYKFPTADDGYPGLIGFQDDNDPTKIYSPGQVVPFDDFTADIHATAIQKHTIEIWSPGPNSQLLKTTTVDRGDSYTFPTDTEQGYTNYKGFAEGSTMYPMGDVINAVERDYKVVAVPKGQYVVTVITPEGDVLRTTSVPEGGDYILPDDLPGIVDFTLEDQSHKNAGYNIGPINKNTVVIANPAGTAHIVHVVDAEDPTNELATGTVEDGDNYELPTITGYKDYTLEDGTTHKDPGDEIGPIDHETTVYANPIYYTVKVVHAETGETLETKPVRYGGEYDLPELDGIVNYTYKQQTLDPKDVIGPIYEDTTVIANPLKHTVKIVHKTTGEELRNVLVNHGDYYKLPTINGIKDYSYGSETFDPEVNFGPVEQDCTLIANPYVTHKITIDGILVATVPDGGDYTFPSGPDAANVGYIHVNGGDILPPGTKITNITEDRDYLSINEIEVQMQGAAMQYVKPGPDDDPETIRGIAFGSSFKIKKVNGEVIDKTVYPSVYSSKAFHLGTLITPNDYYETFFDETLDLSSVEKARQAGKSDIIFNIMNDNTFMNDSNAYATFRAAIVKLRDSNITRDFIARSYAYVKRSDGSLTDVTYANISPTRSIKQIANFVRADQEEYGSLVGEDAWKKTIVDYCADYVG